MMRLTVSMNVRPEKYREVLITLQELTDVMRREKGFIDARILMKGGQTDTVTFVQMWETQDAVDTYMQSDYFQVLRGGLKILTNSWEMEICEPGRPAEHTPHPGHQLE